MDKKSIGHNLVVILILTSAIILVNYNLSCAQKSLTIKTIVKTSDVMGDILEVFTMQGKFYLNQLVRGGNENRNYQKCERIISDSEKRGTPILIKYRFDQGNAREIIDVIPVK